MQTFLQYYVTDVLHIEDVWVFKFSHNEKTAAKQACQAKSYAFYEEDSTPARDVARSPQHLEWAQHAS